MQLEVGSILEGRVTGITAFGAFVALPGGKSGLVHISEVANTYVSDINAFLTKDQTVTVKVLSVTPEGKINLSIRQAQPGAPERRPQRPQQQRAPRTDAKPAPRPAAPRPAAPAAASQPAGGYVPHSSGDQSFEDKLKLFMQESDRKISGSRIYDQQKKSARRRK